MNKCIWSLIFEAAKVFSASTARNELGPIKFEENLVTVFPNVGDDGFPQWPNHGEAITVTLGICAGKNCLYN